MKVYGVELTDLIAAGVLPAPLRLFRNYKGEVLEATLQPDSRVEFRGRVYNTCSSAAEAARETITGRRMSTNGWAFWQYDAGRDGDKTLETVRAAFLASKASHG